jgi:hypothetical protein
MYLYPMLKLLILAYDFPPYVSVGGLRPYNWYKYLKEFGIEPIVVTRQWQNKHGNHLDYVQEGYSPNVVVEKTETGTILRTPYKPNLSNRLLLKFGDAKYKILRRSISGLYEVLQYLYPVGPKSEIYAAARDYLKTNKVDAIIATGDPFVLFTYADQLSKEFDIPWIADYRDPWSQNFSAKKSLPQRKLEQLFEKRIVPGASHINTVDNLFKHKINSLFPNKSISILSNGFDPEAISSVKGIEQSRDTLTFSFVGTIYLWHPLEHLLSCFNELIRDRGINVKIKFYGSNINDNIEEIVSTKYKSLINKAITVPKLANRELLEQLAQDNALLLFNYYEFTGTKIYDYLAIGRKILLCFENDPVAIQLKNRYYFRTIETDENPQIDMINSTHSGVIVKDREHLKKVVMDLYQEFSQTGMIHCDSVGVEKYSRKIQVEKLAEIVKDITKIDVPGDGADIRD